MRILDAGAVFGMRVGQIVHGDHEVVSLSSLNQLEEVEASDLVMFGGGADIHPNLYNSRNVASNVGREPSQRDIFEQAVFRKAVRHGVPVVGICRGAQLVCALSGGILIQDVSNHAGRGHMVMEYLNGTEFEVNSVHHQMMWPYTIADKAAYKVIADTRAVSGRYVYHHRNHPKDAAPAYPDGAGADTYYQHEPEVVYFRNTNSLGIQCHPEWMPKDSPAVLFFNTLINKQIKKEL